MSIQKLFKAYDVRGAYPELINEEVAHRIGRATATFLKCRTALVGHDMRRSSPALAMALIEGLRAQGVNVTFIGQATSPLVYFAGRDHDCAVSVTASHNPPPDNGMKICGKGALPIGSANGLLDIAKLVEKNEFTAAAEPGTLVDSSPREEFVEASLQALAVRRRFKIVVDAGNGMGGPDYATLAKATPLLEVVPMYFEPDDTFPNHEPNPLHFETLRDLQAAVVRDKADLGVALDGDGDRCFFVDETGSIVPADILTALIAQDVLRAHSGATILYDLRSSRVVKEEVEEAGGRAVECRVGHAFIKKALRSEGGIFAGELSGHFYFQESSYAENTLLALFRVLNILDARGVSLSHAIKPLQRYPSSGEVNSKVPFVAAVLQRLEDKYRDGRQTKLDGLKVSYPDWWFNVRPSNTEPLLRLVLEADSQTLMEQKREELLAIIRA
ncbi:MAG: phosphomannomutase/phosphoglucomutase [Acidobacteriota bacterium]